MRDGDVARLKPFVEGGQQRQLVVWPCRRRRFAFIACGDVLRPAPRQKAGGRLCRELAPLVAVDLLKVRHGLAERRVADKAKGSDLQQFRGVPARVGYQCVTNRRCEPSSPSRK
jgi:hypothetical protein